MNVELVKKDCPNCHVPYWIEAAHNERLITSKETFFCPNGHPASYTGKSDSQLLQEAKAQLRAEITENQRLVGIVLERGEKLKKPKKSKKKKKEAPP